MSDLAQRVTVRGNATAEELAAVLAVVTHADAVPEPSDYARWRATRLAAVRATTARDTSGCATIVR